MNAKTKNAAKIAVSLLMALVLVLGLFAPIASVAHADEVDSNIAVTAADEQQQDQKDEQKEEATADYLSASYLIPVICVLAVLIGFYIFLSVKTGKKKPKKPSGKKPVKKP